MKLEEIIKTESQIDFHKIEKDRIVKIDVEIFGHFGDLPSLLVVSYTGRSIIRGYNNVQNLGYLIRALIRFLEIDCENSKCLDRVIYYCDYSTWGGIPIRVVYDKSNRIIGIGHITKDSFILVEDLMQIDAI